MTIAIKSKNQGVNPKSGAKYNKQKSSHKI